MKVVLANSIGLDSNGYYIIHSPSRWSEGVRNKENWFAYYPWELAYCSALLKKHTDARIKFVDGCLERLDYSRYLRKIESEYPDWLIMESASRMIDENLKLASELKKRLGTKIVFVGQHATVFPEYVLRNGADFACIGEYEYAVLELISGKDPDEIEGLYPNKRRPLLDINSLPWPEDEDVSRLDYGTPGEPSSEYLEIQMYASRGCPRSCGFCVARNVYYAKPNWRARDVGGIIDELKYLRGRYPKMQGVFFDEEEHNVDKGFIMRLTKSIIDNGLDDLHYEAMCDINSLDREVMESMRNAGYYKIRVGIESTSTEVLSASGKNIATGDVTKKLELAKEAGLKTYGTFMIGMPGSSEKTDRNTSLYIKHMILDGILDNAQISVCTPQPGTPFYDYAKSNKFIITDDYQRYDGGKRPIVDYPAYSRSAIESTMVLAYRTREHATFLRKARQNELPSWLIRTVRKYGVFKAAVKLLRRLKLETANFIKRRNVIR